MNASNKAEQLEFFDMFHAKMDDPAPLPLPRFGKIGPTSPKALQLSGTQSQRLGEHSSFHLVWDDPDLGIHIEFQEQPSPTGTEIMAFVTGRIENQGQSVVIILAAEKELKFLQRSAILTLDNDKRTRGQVSFGSVADVVTKLGATVAADAFLMEH